MHLHSARSRGPVLACLYCGTMAETPSKLEVASAHEEVC